MIKIAGVVRVILMSTVSHVFFNSIKYLLFIVVIDIVLGVGLYVLDGFDITVSSLKNVMFLEVALLFIVGGLLDFSQAQTTAGMRRFLGDKGAKYSTKKHVEAQKRGAALVLTGVWLMALTLTLDLI